ncbi:prolyl aminopeptidase [Dongshaea marina]|uniref:prolyl aminopeptidase n=1 Tax=Dongshaea marina TaxID=2047966 RepID=UPI000D3E7DE8|nr:prolyl aminopeptidase [Dongshaea marina]
MRGLFPALHTDHQWQLEVNHKHTLYIEQSGNPEGIPVLILHNGPGESSNPDHRRFFDPERYRIIQFDQRGCGRSQPHASLSDNNTQALIADIEQIRQQLGIDRWLVFGSGWGSLLALCYSSNHHEQVLGLLLHSVQLGRQQDIDWQFSPDGGAAQLFPEHFTELLAPLERPSSTQSILEQYQQLLTSPNELSRLHAARCWSQWKARTASLLPSQSLLQRFEDPHIALALARIENHYLCNHFFIPERYLQDSLEPLRSLPGVMIHGRYDMQCKLENSLTLARQWPESQLQIIPAAGHSCFEPAIIDALVKASDVLAQRLERNR